MLNGAHPAAALTAHAANATAETFIWAFPRCSFHELEKRDDCDHGADNGSCGR